MENVRQTEINTGGGADLAFAIVVLATYFGIFSAAASYSALDLGLMILFGVAYIAIGIYGYHYCNLSESQILKVIYFIVQITLGCLIITLGRDTGFSALLLLPLAGHSVVMLPRGWMLVTNAVLLLAYVITIFLLREGWGHIWDGLPTFMAGQVFILFFTLMAVNEELSRNKAEKLVQDLAEANQQLREYAFKVEELAVAKERNRLAREIHDGLGHYLTAIHVQLQAARAVLGTDLHKAEDTLGKAQSLAQDALVDIRRSVAALRAPQHEGLPLMLRIKALLGTSEMQGIITSLIIKGEERSLRSQTELTIYRAVQEGLNNAYKHAQATNVWITLDFSKEDFVKLTVLDDGLGAEKFDGGFGLIGIKERVNLLLGRWSINSKEGQGACLEIEVPE
jgi:signal transduction histidine kinase